jgi:biopolymer transport protein ExbB
MPEFEAVGAVRDFVEQGGNVLLVIAFVTAVMWALIYERFWYFRTDHKREVQRAKRIWTTRTDHSSWSAHQIRRMLVSDVRLKLQRNLGPINTVVKLCPMLGLLGTVTGMIEVFDVMALSGSGNARGMAAGVSKATLPTMAGMVAALSGMLFAVQLDRFTSDESERVADGLEIGHG